MTKNTIEFQPLSQDTEVPVRRSFRVPVCRQDNVLAILNRKTFSVANLSATGIAIHSESCLEFEQGQILEGSQLWLGTTRLTGLVGKVVHCSVYATGDLQFGIEWQKMTPESRDQLAAMLEKLQIRVLKAGSGSDTKDPGQGE